MRPTFLLGRAGTAGQDRGAAPAVSPGMSPTPTSRAVPREPSRGVGFRAEPPRRTGSVLEEQVKALEAQYEGVRSHAPLSGAATGSSPTCIEFWQGRENGLHDRARPIAAKMERGDRAPPAVVRLPCLTAV